MRKDNYLFRLYLSMDFYVPSILPTPVKMSPTPSLPSPK